MSGHSHYATIKRKKEVTDAVKGRMFSKFSRAIAIAIKTGGGPDPEMNYKLRVAIDTAKASNMPKSNIDRILSKASEATQLDDVRYEGFGPDGIYVIVDVATDNRNRSGQEIKNIFERGGGNLAGPNSVAYNFDPKGYILIAKTNNSEDQLLKLIDLGVEDIKETDEDIEVYVDTASLSDIAQKVRECGYSIKEASLIMRPKTIQRIGDENKAKKIIAFLDKLEENDDVQDVFTNFDIADAILEKMV